MKLGKCIVLIFTLAILLRGLVALGADTALDALLQTAIGDGDALESTVLRQSSLLMATADGGTAPEPIPVLYQAEPPAEPVCEGPPPPPPPIQLPIYRSSRAERIPEVTLTDGDPRWSIADIHIRNHTTYTIDPAALLEAPLSFTPDVHGEPPTVLILHTHGSESFEPDGDDWYDNVDNYRTSDKNLNIIRVGAEIAAVFEARGIRVIHHREIHDYPSFRGSYGRSLAAAEQYLAKYPEIQVIFDIHRDAILDAAGNYVKTMANIEGIQSAQVMLVVGTDHAGLYHPNWRNNLQFALHLQASMVARYPGLARPLSLREERFNAHLTPGSVLVEIGACGNTLQEALIASRFFAEAAADVLLAINN